MHNEELIDKLMQQDIDDFDSEQALLSRVTRVEVIDDSGRAYTNLKVENIVIGYQDDGKTLKIFISGGGDEFIIR